MWIIPAAALLAGGWLLWEKKVAEKERALLELAFDEFEIKDATFEEAFRQIEAKVHALGHPEMKLVLYPASKAPGFHALVVDKPRSTSPGIPGVDGQEKEKIHLSIKFDGTNWQMEEPGPFSMASGGSNPIKLEKILQHIVSNFGCACALRGDALIATPVAGTFERFRKETIRVNLMRDWTGPSDQEIREKFRESGVLFYEGMTVSLRQGRGEIDELKIYGPKSQIELIDFLVSPHPPSLFQEYCGRVRNWWLQLRFRFFP